MVNNSAISILPLSEDLERASICIYRSSASSIEAARTGVIPIHIDFSGDLNLDPFDPVFFHRNGFRANSYEELGKLMRDLTERNSVKPQDLILHLQEFALNYFTNPKNSEFQKHLMERESRLYKST